MPCLIINLLIYIIAGIVCSAGAAAIFHVLAHIVINFFVVPLIGTLLGAVLAIYAKKRRGIYRIACYYFLFEPCGKWLLRGFILFHWYIRKQMVKSFSFYDAVVIFFIHLISLTVIHLDRIDYLLFNVDIGALCVASFLLRTKPLW